MVDDAWRTRIPQGWQQFPDGSIGPPNSVGSDWNAPYRQPSGMGYPPSGILPPEAPGTPDQVSGRVGYPGIPTRTSPALSAPGAGYPAIDAAISGQPAGTPPVEQGSFGDPHSRWEKERPWTWREPHIDRATGQPEMLTGPGGIAEKNRAGFNPLSILGGNQFWRGLIAAGGVMTPTPAETGEYNPAMITGRPDAPWNTTHGLPAPAAPPQRGMPWPDTGVAPGGGGGAMPARPVTPPPATAYPAAAAAAPIRNPFAWVDRPNADVAGGALSRGGPPKMSALDLSGLFGGGQPAAVAPAAAPSRTKIPATARADVPPQASGPMDPSIIARRKMKRLKASSTSQGGGYQPASGLTK